MSNHQLFREVVANGFYIGGVERNSTSFTKENLEKLRKIKKDKNDPLRYHQRIAYEYVVNNPDSRGILLNHVMGAGKTISAIAIAEGLLEQNSDRRIVIMAAKSLHDNMRQNVEKYMKLKSDISSESVTKHINENYQFISLNASNMLTQVHRAMHKSVDTSIFDDDAVTAEEAEEFGKLDKLGNLEGSTLLIDEAHNLFNAISNGSKNAIGLYKLIMNAKDIKVIFLSGSPITNDPFEIAIAMNMIAGPINGKHSLFGEDYMDFTKHFVGSINVVDENSPKDPDGKPIPRPRPHIINREKFMNRLVGLVSYYGADDPEQRALYPEQLPWHIRRIKMSPKQYAAYITARDREREESTRGSKFKADKQPLQKPGSSSSSYRVRSRQLSNFLYPEGASKTWKNERGYILYEKYIDKLDPKQLMDQGSSGKGTDESKMGLEVWSPKILDMLHNIQRHCPFKFISIKPGATAEKSVKKIKSTKKKIKKGGAPELSIAVRPIIEDDWELIETQFRIHFEDKYIYKKDSVGYVALDKDEVVGWAIINPKTQAIRYLRVIPPYQKRGIGTILWTMVTEKYRAAKFTLTKDHGAARLESAKKYGFKVVNESTKVWHLERSVSGGGDTTVRLVTKKSSDVEAIERLIQETGGKSYADTNEPKTAYFIYDNSSQTKPVGFVVLRPGYASNKKQRHDTSYLVNMGITKSKRGKGLGSALIKSIKKNHPRIYLKVLNNGLDSTINVSEFYKKNGFSVYRASPEKLYMRILGGKSGDCWRCPYYIKRWNWTRVSLLSVY